MWERSQLKEQAKQVLRVSYWKALFISLIIALVGGNSGGINFNFELPSNKLTTGTSINEATNGSVSMGPQTFTDGLKIANDFGDLQSHASISDNTIMLLVLVVLIIALVVLAGFIAFRLFVGYSLEVGGRRYFIRSTNYDIKIDHVGFSFHRGQYMSVIKAMAWRDLFTFLWTLLFIIPGIVKSYSYMMIPYIMAENPQMDYRRAMKLSMKMTDGQKFDIFILQLSFFGWYLLGALCFLIGVIFVTPYKNATLAELYVTLRNGAIARGYCSPDEFNLVTNEATSGQ